jgi:hypothetical protein
VAVTRRNRVRSHNVNRAGKTFTRSKHTRKGPAAAKPSPMRRGIKKPLLSRRPRPARATPTAGPAQAVKKAAAKHPKAATAAGWGAPAVLTALAVTVMAGAGGPLLVAAVALVLHRQWLKRGA